jgi:hypothetical protein
VARTVNCKYLLPAIADANVVPEKFAESYASGRATAVNPAPRDSVLEFRPPLFAVETTVASLPALPFISHARITVSTSGAAVIEYDTALSDTVAADGSMPKNSFTESINAKLEAPDALPVIARPSINRVPKIRLRMNIECDRVLRLDICILNGLRPITKAPKDMKK